jgi:FlaG/FlaF family flagellin (archaellin)
MSFMIKIAFVLQATVAAAVGLGTPTSTPAPTEQNASVPVVERASCAVCDEVYDSCIAEGLTPAGCTRLVANCRKNCLP